MTTKLEDIGATVTATADLQQWSPDTTGASAIKGIRVFDVGQGDCIGLRDQNDNVFCYVDYGGLADHPDKLRPLHTAKRMPVQLGGHYVSIVLTHWDKDHYWSAKKKNPNAQNCSWLVPRQLVSPKAVLFAQSLVNAKCWPESFGQKAHSFAIGKNFEVQIRKCGKFVQKAVNEDRNKTGLALSLVRRTADGTDSAMILPGDCAFDAIPNWPTEPICALVAYHHGSSTHWTNSTSSAIATTCSHYRMAYSFGSNNRYGHPNRTNYQNCQPNWDAQSVATEDVRANGNESADIDW